MAWSGNRLESIGSVVARRRPPVSTTIHSCGVPVGMLGIVAWIMPDEGVGPSSRRSESLLKHAATCTEETTVLGLRLCHLVAHVNEVTFLALDI